MKARRIVFGAVPAVFLLGGLVACGASTVSGSAAPEQVIVTQTTTTTIPTTTAPAAKTVYVQPTTRTVYVTTPGYAQAQDQWYAQQSWIDSQPWIDITPGPGQTDCQWLHANGYSYAQAYAAWAQNGYPSNWSATNDGYPCQRSYGMQH